MDVNCFMLADAMEMVEFLLEGQQEFYQFAYDGLSQLSTTVIVGFPLFAAVLVTTFLGQRVLVPSAKFVLWSLVLIRLILPVSFESSFSLQRSWSLVLPKIAINRPARLPLLIINHQVTSEPSSQAPVDGDSSESDSSTQPRKVRSSVIVWFRSFGARVSEIWPAWLFAGSSLFACGSIVGFVRWISWWRNGRDCSDPCCVGLVNQGRRRFGIRANVRLRTVRQLTCPAMFDWFWPVIFVPETIALYSESERRDLIWHELARIRTGDSATSVLWHLVRIVHWWNVLFVWAQHRWLAEREIACDALAITQIPADEISSYAATLQLLHQAQPKSTWFAWWSLSPGFVTQPQSISILRQRLKVLTIPQSSGSRGQAMLSWSAVIALAAAGLTDPPSIPLKVIPIELPAGTTWHDSGAFASAEAELETREYDLTKCIERLEQQDPTAAREVHSESIRRAINNVILIPEDSARPQSLSQSADHQLMVHATATEHVQIAELISNWETHGRRQICIEVRFMSTVQQLSQLLPASGGRVFNSQPAMGLVGEDLRPFGIADGAHLRETLTSPVPVFQQALSDSQFMSFVLRVQGDSRAQVSMAPKVTLFEGEAAAVIDQRSRPFVTGLLNPHGGSHLPKVSTIDEGLSFHIFGSIVTSKVRLRIAMRASSIVDVSTQKFSAGSNELNIQSPEVSEQICEVVADVHDGEHLLLVPLKRTGKELRAWQVTPRIVDEADEELSGVPRAN